MTRLILSCAFFLSSFFHLHAQELTFHSISTEQGLPGSECHSIRQDSKGYLWVGTTAGLAKFNGRSFRTFTTADGLTDNTIFETYEDEQGRLFYSTSSSRIGYIKNDSAFTLPVTDTLARLLNSGRRFIKSISDYDKENLLIATQIGFFILDKKTLSRLAFLPAPKDAMLWIKVVNGRAFCANYEQPASHPLTPADHYTLCIEANGKQTFLSFNFDMVKISALAVFKTLQLADGRLLIGFWDKVITVYPDASLDTMNLQARLLSFYQDHNGGLWLSMFQNGLFYYSHGNFSEQPQHLLDDLSPTCICMDTENGIWVSTEFDGLHHCSSLNIVAYPNEKNLNVRMSALDYIPPYVVANGSNTQVYFFMNKNTWQKSRVFPGDSSRGASSFHKYGKYIYAAGLDFTYLLDTSFNVIKTIPDEIYPRSMMYNLTEGKDHRMWGIRFNDLVSFRNDTLFLDKKLPARGKDICSDSAGNIYVATNNGLYVRDENKFLPIKNLFCKINRLRCDPSGKMWACTDGMGLVCLDSVNIIHHYTSANGLPSNICYDVAFDEKGNIWLATNNGLCSFNILSSEKINYYKTNQGLLSNEVLKLALMKNELYISTSKGLCVADINHLESVTISPPIYIVSITNNNLSAEHHSAFSYYENNFTFHVEGISFRNSSGISYLYRLNGIQTEWETNTTGEITLSNLNDGQYTFEVYALTADGTRSKFPATYTFTISPPFWERGWFLFIAAIVAAGLVYGMISWRIRNIRKKESEKTKLNKLIAEYQMSAIQAQMNPHFIFNAINSIQNYILNNDTRNAYDYLTKFSNLIRMILINSKHSTISLEKELSTLELYIQLEQRRFSNRFTYEITIDPSIPAEEIKIPVLLIQPFVENAIWHGIMNMKSTSEGKILINLGLRDEELIITVEDNGVGRSQSVTLKKEKNHEPIGMMLSEKRLEILKALGHEDSRIVITDLYDKQGVPCGTRVELFLPMKF